MAAKTNTVVTSNVSAAREIVFVSSFTQRVQFIKDLMGDVRFMKIAPGENVVIKKANVTLNTTAVGEGESIPYSAVNYTSTPIGTIPFDKKKIGISIESIGKGGYADTVASADKNAVYKLTAKFVNDFVTFAKTGTTTVSATNSTFQMAVAKTIGATKNKWDSMDMGYDSIVGFCNVLDAYNYLGAANITTQNENGMEYLKNFMGFSKLFLTSKVESGKIVATPSNNIVIPYIDMKATDYGKAGFNFYTDGELNLIAAHVEPNYDTGVGELLYVTAHKMIAEYIDGITVTTFTTGA